MRRYEQLLIFLSASLSYWLLRFHPVSYDVGRHIELFAMEKSYMYRSIAPGHTSFEIMRYGLLSQFAPMTPLQTTILFWGLGWAGFVLLTWAAGRWSKQFFKNSWYGVALVLLIELFGERNLLLASSHPFELAVNLIFASIFLALSGSYSLAIALCVCGLLAHPNLVLAVFLVLLWIRRLEPKTLRWSAAAYAVAVAYYLGTSSWRS